VALERKVGVEIPGPWNGRRPKVRSARQAACVSSSHPNLPILIPRPVITSATPEVPLANKWNLGSGGTPAQIILARNHRHWNTPETFTLVIEKLNKSGSTASIARRSHQKALIATLAHDDGVIAGLGTEPIDFHSGKQTKARCHGKNH